MEADPTLNGYDVSMDLSMQEPAGPEPEPAPLTSIHPLGPQVVLERIKNAVSKGGIIIPDQALNNSATFWRVLAVGPGQTLPNGMIRPMSFAVGAKVAMVPGAQKVGGELDLTDSAGQRRRVLVIHEDSCCATVD